MFRGYKLRYVTHGFGKHGPKLYGVLRIKSDRGWVVEVWPCDMNGAQVSDPIDWREGLSWWSAVQLFWSWYNDYDKFVYHRV